MPFLAPLAPLLLAGGSAAAGALSNRKGARTSTSESKSGSRSSQTTTSEFGAASGLNSQLLQTLMARLQDPTAGTEGIRAAGRTNINRQFRAALQSIANNLLAFGGKSGKAGSAFQQVELGRGAALAGFEGDITKQIFDRENDTLTLGQALLGLNRGQTSTGTNDVTSSGTDVGAGSALAGGVNAGLETGTLLFALNNLLKN